MAVAGSGHDMVLRMLADTNQYLREIKKAQTATHAFRDAVAGAARFIRDAMSTAFGVMGGNFLTGAISGITGRVWEWVKGGFELNATLIQSRESFGVMFGSVRQGNALVEQLYQYAAKTVFEFENLNKAAGMLAASGVGANQILPVLRTLGELGNTNTRPIEQIAALYAKIKSAGRITGEERRQFSALGIPIEKELAAVMGVEHNKLYELIEQGRVGFTQFQQAIINLTQEGGRFHEMQKKLAQTVPGIWATLKDSIKMAGAQLAESLIEIFDLKELMQQGIRLGDWMKQIIQQWTPVVKGWWVWFRAEAANAFWDLTAKGLTFVASFLESMTRFGTLLEGVLTRIEGVLKSIQELLPKLPAMPGMPKGDEKLSSLQSPLGQELMNELGIKPEAKPATVGDAANAAAAKLRELAATAQANVGSNRFFPPLPGPMVGPQPPQWPMRIEPGQTGKEAKAKEAGDRDVLAKALSGRDAYQAIYDAMKEQKNEKREEENRANLERTAKASEAAAARLESVANDFNELTLSITGAAL